MLKLTLALLIVVLTIIPCFADRVYIENGDMIIPVDVNENGTTYVSHGNGDTTAIYDSDWQTTIVDGKGDTTTIYK